MILKRLHTSTKQKKDLISWRGHEVTRIEAFSDAIFAFAVTLLIVSLEVPKSFEEMMESMRGFIPFAICFMIFFQVWSSQNLFFRRYGMHDEPTLILNAILLFVVLFFVYPMKFLWSTLFLKKDFALESAEQVRQLYYIYSGGFTAIYLLFSLMYIHAYRRREHINLTKSEVFETKTYIYRHLFTAFVGVISLTCAYFGNGIMLAFAGIAYILLGPFITMVHARRAKLHKKHFESAREEQPVIKEDVRGEKIEAE